MEHSQLKNVVKIPRSHTHQICTAVVGVGYLGHYHAQKFATLKKLSKLVGVCDIDEERCQEMAQKYQIKAFSNYRHLIGKIDAVSIATPTPQHYEIAKFFLENGVHVLVEKPITTTLKEADELIKIARKNKLILQVGHLERFNNVIKALRTKLTHPLFFESERLAPFKLRGSDVNVVLDLMIHDIDIIQSLVSAKIKNISANGVSVLSPFIDIANARIEFENGCVANVKASRVSLKVERKLRIFQHDGYFSLDLENKTLAAHRKGRKEMFPGIPEIVHTEQNYEKGDALLEQIIAFLHCIIDNKPPIVSGEDGRNALAVATQISQIVRENNKIAYSQKSTDKIYVETK